jgi:hypothetical protein
MIFKKNDALKCGSYAEGIKRSIEHLEDNLNIP